MNNKYPQTNPKVNEIYKTQCINNILQKQPIRSHSTQFTTNSSIKCVIYNEKRVRNKKTHSSDMMFSIFIEKSSNDIPIKYEICNVIEHFPLNVIININPQKYHKRQLISVIYRIFTDSMNLSQDITNS